MENKQIKLMLNGLDCANCASKIERKASQLESIQEVSVNVSNQLMVMVLTDSNQETETIKQVTDIVHMFEPEVDVQRIDENLIRQSYLLEGLDCANCANKIQTQIEAIDGLSQVSVDFATTKLSYQISDQIKAKDINNQVAKIVKAIEPDVIMREVSKKPIASKTTSNRRIDDETKKEIMTLAISGVLFLIAVCIPMSFYLKLSLYIASYFISGRSVLQAAFRNIRNKELFDENFLMSIATIGAFAIGEYPEGVAVMLFYQIGEIFQSLAVNQSRRSIAELMDIRPDYANLETADGHRVVFVDEVNVSDIIVIKAGEKVPLDGRIIEGTSLLDTSALTGESMLREVVAGDEVYGGFINQNGLLRVEVLNQYADSKVAKILELVEHASSKKAPTEQFITKFARVYTPIVVISALLLAFVPPLVFQQPLSEWVYRALIFLVVSCPCALVVSIPLGFFGGIGAASKRGILVKGGNYLEALKQVDTILFDKTGTLTKGIFKVTDIQTYLSYTKEEVLEIAAQVEQFSNHPIAKSILLAYEGKVDASRMEDVEEVTGQGVTAKLDGERVLVGNARWMQSHSLTVTPPANTGTILYVSKNQEVIGSIVIADELKDDALTLVAGLKQAGIRKTVMLTGDIDQVGQSVAKRLQLDHVHTQLMPDDKVILLEEYMSKSKANQKIMFVGDGINDAPVLARADVGVAMGGLGSDAAIEAADIVLMSDEPSQLITAIDIAKQTSKIVWQNIILAFAVKGLVLILGAGGLATMWEAVFADVGVTFLAVLNSIRILRVK